MIYERDPKKADENLDLFLSRADRGEDHVRIISARSATPTEAHAYQESRK